MPGQSKFFQKRVEIGLTPAAIGLDHFKHAPDVLLDIETAEDRGFLPAGIPVPSRARWYIGRPVTS